MVYVYFKIMHTTVVIYLDKQEIIIIPLLLYTHTYVKT